MPLVLLAAIVVAGVVAALFITVDTGVDTARRDRDWHAAINAADAGLQEAVAVIRDSDIEIACPGGECSGSLSDGSTYVATYTETDDGLLLVCSVGTVNDVDREACTEYDLNLMFGGAGVVGVDKVSLGNLPGFTVDDVIVGTAGVFDFNGNPCDKIEGVEIYYPSTEDNPCPEGSLRRTSRTFPNLAEIEFTEGACAEANGAVIWDSYPADRPDDEPEPWVYGTTYCTRLIDLPKQDIVLQGEVSNGPVKVFADPGCPTGVAGAKYAGNGTVNIGGEASNLQFFVRCGKVDLDMKGTTRIKAVWYAPDSSCDLRGTPDFTGAIVCRTASLGGSVNFVVPDDIKTLRAGPTVVERWYER